VIDWDGPGLHAQLDQFEAGLKPIAAMLISYRVLLQVAGFKSDQAFQLVLRLHSHLYDLQLKAAP
jgi:hypothetical protein